MSTEYQHTHVTGESWLRAKRIVIDNPLGELPSAKFVEERIVNIAGGDQFRRDAGVLEAPATPDAMEEVIPLVNPATGELTGESVTYGQAQAVLHSAYLHFADLRDNPPEPDLIDDGADDEPVEEEEETTTDDDGGTA